MIILKRTFYISLPLLLICLLFIPKIDLISIPGYWQGIRLEDLIMLSFAMYLITNYKKTFLKSDYQFKPVLIFITYFFFSNFVGYYSGLKIMPFPLLRFFEYAILILFLNNLNVTELFLKRISFIYILVNVLISLLQEIDLIGSFSSLGYLPASSYFNARAYGLTGGSWELGVTSSIAFLIFLKHETNKINISIALTLTIILVSLAEGRANFIAFFVTVIFIYITSISVRKLLIIIIGLFILTVITQYFYFEYYQNFTNLSLISRMDGFDIVKMSDLLKNFIMYNDYGTRDEIVSTHPNLLSLFFRLNLWSILYDQFNTNIFTQLFGVGVTKIYMDSLLIRIWFSTGYVGIILLICLLKDMKIYQLIFFLLAGFSLDIFMSFKIVLLALMLNLKSSKSNENNKNLLFLGKNQWKPLINKVKKFISPV